VHSNLRSKFDALMKSLRRVFKFNHDYTRIWQKGEQWNGHDRSWTQELCRSCCCCCCCSAATARQLFPERADAFVQCMSDALCTQRSTTVVLKSSGYAVVTGWRGIQPRSRLLRSSVDRTIHARHVSIPKTNRLRSLVKLKGKRGKCSARGDGKYSSDNDFQSSGTSASRTDRNSLAQPDGSAMSDELETSFCQIGKKDARRRTAKMTIFKVFNAIYKENNCYRRLYCFFKVATLIFLDPTGSTNN